MTTTTPDTPDLELVWDALSNHGQAEAARFNPDLLAAQLGLSLDRFTAACTALADEGRIALQPAGASGGVRALIQYDPEHPEHHVRPHLYALLDDLLPRPAPRPRPSREGLCTSQDQGGGQCTESAVYSFWPRWRGQYARVALACEHHWKTRIEPRLIDNGDYAAYDPHAPNPARRQWLIKSWLQRERSEWRVAIERRRQSWSPAYARANVRAGTCAACDRPLAVLIFVYTTQAGSEIVYCDRDDCACV